MGATYDDLDDVRIAAEELFVYACDHADEGSEVTMEFLLGDEDVTMSVRLPQGVRATDEDAERDAAYATFILQSVSDHYQLSSDLDGLYLKVVKHLAAGLDDAGS
jgi:serine/threonine-protein kinase RsbW